MVSEECARVLKLGGENGWELATTNASNIVGFGASVRVFNTLEPERIAKRKEALTKRFFEAVSDDAYISVLNPEDAFETGMVCLEVKDAERAREYRELVSRLQKLNVFVRYIEKPLCLRVCFHYYNSETDVDMLVGSLKSLLEGIDRHRGDQRVIKKNIKGILRKSVTKDREQGSIDGLLIYGPPATGKSTIIEEILEELKEEGVIEYGRKIVADDIFSKTKKELPQERLINILEEAEDKRPSCVFFDEVDALFTKAPDNPLNSTFIPFFDRISKEGKKVFFIGATNKVLDVSDNIRVRRLDTAYFPLPSFETRLKILIEKAQEVPKLEENIEFERIASDTDMYSMKDMERLFEKAVSLTKGSTLKQSHFDEALESVKPQCNEKAIKRFDKIIKKLDSMKLSH